MDKKVQAIEKIKKLLRLSKSSNEHEAALAAAHAQRLLSEYNLNEADLTEAEIPKEAEMAYAETVKKPATWLFLLASSVAGAFDCKYFHQSNGKTFFIGVGIDHEVAAFTFGYIYRAIQRLAANFMAKSQQKRLTIKGQRKARQSFCLGAAQVVANKLRTQRATIQINTTALVPIKQALVQAKFETLGLESRQVEQESVSDRSFWAGYHKGASIDHERKAMPKNAKPLRIGR